MVDLQSAALVACRLAGGIRREGGRGGLRLGRRIGSQRHVGGEGQPRREQGRMQAMTSDHARKSFFHCRRVAKVSTRSAGMNPTPSQCYAFTTLPLFGGEYKTDNIWMCSWSEWISYTASIYAQTKDLPDGTPVSISVVD